MKVADGRCGAVFYAAEGEHLVRYDVDPATATLHRRESIRAPAPVMYAWQHGNGGFLYVVSSNRGPDASADLRARPPQHYLSAFAVDRSSGALRAHGDHVLLRQRPIHVSVDAASEHVLVAYSDPGGISIHRINAQDGTLGPEFEQAALDTGILPHQIRVTPSKNAVIVVARGYDAAGAQAERPGSIRVFNYAHGRLTPAQTVAPNGGYGFGPRHLDFHPTQPWVYVSIERQHKVCMFRMEGDRLSAEPVFSVETLGDPHNVRPRQMASTIHVHPNGRWLYGAERASGTGPAEGGSVFVGGENTILFFSIDPHSGEPRLVQRIGTTGLHPRTFSIDPSGRMLVVANKSPVAVIVGGERRVIPASLDVFAIADDGRLRLMRNYPVDPGKESMFWSGFAALPSS